MWTTVAEFHPVTLAAPLLLWCVWAAEERRYAALTVLAALALLTKEEVGLALAVLGVWMFVRGTGRRYGPVLAAVSIVWVAFAVKVVIPHFNEGRGTEFSTRYDVGSPLGGGAVDRRGYDRISYLGALLIPLLFLPLLAPLLAAAALPEVLINVLAEYFPQYSIQFQYVAVIVPFLVAASILGLATLRRRAARRSWPRPSRRTGAVAAVWVGTVALSGVYLGPLPWWGAIPAVGSGARTEQYRVTDHSRVMARAVALIPDDVPVSAGNLFGSHLSERERVYTFPVIGDARWIIVNARRPYLADRLLPRAHAVHLAALAAPAGPAARVPRGRGVGVPAGGPVMGRRAAGALLLGLGAAMAALPAFGWYTAPPVGAPTHASGFAGAGQLWLLPALGALVVLAGALQLRPGPGNAATTARVAGRMAAACGAVALGLSVWAAADPRLDLAAGPPAGPARLPTAIDLEAAAVVTPLVAGAVCSWGWGWRSPAGADEAGAIRSAAAPLYTGALAGFARLAERKGSGRSPVVAWVASRALVIGAAIVLSVLLGVPERGVNPYVPDWLSLLGGWDTTWYLDVARHGYAHDMGQVGGDLHQPRLLPAHAGADGRGASASASTRSSRRSWWPTLAFLGGAVRAVVAHARPRRAWSPPTGRSGRSPCCPPRSTAPSPTPRALALAGAIGAALAAVRGRWAAAGLLAAVASLSRPTGGIVVLLLVCSPSASRPRARCAASRWRWLPSVVAVGAFLGWMAVARGSAFLPSRRSGRGTAGSSASDRHRRAARDRGGLGPGPRRALHRRVDGDGSRPGVPGPYAWLLVRLWRREGGLRSPWVAYSAAVLADPGVERHDPVVGPPRAAGVPAGLAAGRLGARAPRPAAGGGGRRRPADRAAGGPAGDQIALSTATTGS